MTKQLEKKQPTRIFQDRWYPVAEGAEAIGISHQLLTYYINKPWFKPEDIKSEEVKKYSKASIKGSALSDLKTFLSLKNR